MEIHNDIYIRTAPRINSLIRITDNIQTAVFPRQLFDQRILQAVNILELIDQDIFKAPLPLVHDFRKLFEHLHSPQDQIIKIQGRHLLLTVQIIGIYFRLILVIRKLSSHILSLFGINFGRFVI